MHIIAKGVKFDILANYKPLILIRIYHLCFRFLEFCVTFQGVASFGGTTAGVVSDRSSALLGGKLVLRCSRDDRMDVRASAVIDGIAESFSGRYQETYLYS